MKDGGKTKAALGPTRWLYGLNPVREALRAGSGVRAVYIYSGRRRLAGELKAEAASRGVAVRIMHDQGFFESRFPKGHQGVAAEVEPRPSVSLEELLDIPIKRGEPAFFVVMDLIEDPRNLGAILRSAEAAGAHGVLMQERRSAGLGPEALKASAGAAEHIPICVLPNIKHAIARMKETGMAVVGAEAGPYPAPWDIDLSGAVGLVIGSEARGMRKTVGEKCDAIVSLPMAGRVGSLNASVAAGVLIYEALRQRRKSTA